MLRALLSKACAVSVLLLAAASAHHSRAPYDMTKEVVFEGTVEDPTYLTGPASHSVRWDHRPDLTHSDEPCDPENARRALE
jgi:hypothetical protein